MQRERTNRAQVPRTFARLEQRRADTRVAWARPPGGMADRLGSLSFAFRLLASKRAADVAAPLRPGKYELDYGGHEVPRLSKNHWSSPVRRLM